MKSALTNVQGTAETITPLSEIIDVLGNAALYSTTRVLIKYDNPVLIKKTADVVYSVLREIVREQSTYYDVELYKSIFTASEFPLLRQAAVKVVEFFPPQYSEKPFYGEYFHYTRLINDDFLINYGQFLDVTHGMDYIYSQPHFYQYVFPSFEVLNALYLSGSGSGLV